MQHKEQPTRGKLLLVELNEINFDLAREYVEPLKLNNFQTLMNGPQVRTASETAYDDIEPWIQWVSAHTGKTADEHGVHRLGDIVGSGVPQMFEQLEAQGLKVGCVSAMNAENRLKNPAYFVPDPWTATPTDGSFWSEALGKAIAQAVNDNSKGKITLKSAAALGLGLLRFARVKHYPLYAKLAMTSRGAPWRKALFLDLFLHDFHWTMLHSRNPDFSTVFLNAGAHIQHHYMFSSRAITAPKPDTKLRNPAWDTPLRNPAWYCAPHLDPTAEMLTVYNSILGDYLSLEKSWDVMIATGLNQQPNGLLKYYWRLTDHAGFLKSIGIKFKSVLPRMTRDFLVEFDSAEDALAAQRRFASFRSPKNDAPIFGDIENRGTSLFLSLIYPHEVTPDFVATYEGGEVRLAQWVVFVQLKNGKHHPHGYAFCRSGLTSHAPADGAHVKGLYGTIMSYFASSRAKAGQSAPGRLAAAH